MKIKDLPEDIRELARKRFLAERGVAVNPDFSIGSFTWCKTPEGYNFWMSYLDVAYYGVMATNIRMKNEKS